MPSCCALTATSSAIRSGAGRRDGWSGWRAITSTPRWLVCRRCVKDVRHLEEDVPETPPARRGDHTGRGDPLLLPARRGPQARGRGARSRGVDAGGARRGKRASRHHRRGAGGDAGDVAPCSPAAPRRRPQLERAGRGAERSGRGGRAHARAGARAGEAASGRSWLPFRRGSGSDHSSPTAGATTIIRMVITTTQIALRMAPGFSMSSMR